jgi:hypothetical protein
MDAGEFGRLYGELPEDEKRKVDAEIARARPLPSPPKSVVGALWLVVVCAFSLLLLGGTLMVFFLVRAGDSTEVVGPIVTAALGVLAGLLAPSPVQESKSGS